MHQMNEFLLQNFPGEKFEVLSNFRREELASALRIRLLFFNSNGKLKKIDKSF
jgi:hypothetical protein